MALQTNPTHLPEDEDPPVFSSWSRVYLAVVVYWAALLLVLYYLSRVWTYE